MLVFCEEHSRLTKYADRRVIRARLCGDVGWSEALLLEPVAERYNFDSMRSL
jgi:hypothetical protein